MPSKPATAPDPSSRATTPAGRTRRQASSDRKGGASAKGRKKENAPARGEASLARVATEPDAAGGKRANLVSTKIGRDSGNGKPRELTDAKAGKPRQRLPLRRRPAEVRRLAIELFARTQSWVVFYREILGPDGVVGKLFADDDDRYYWETTDEYFEVHEMLTALRSTDTSKVDMFEPQKMITIRLPECFMKALQEESNRHETSLNRLCISKLLVSIDPRFVALEPGRRRGRKFGPQGSRPRRDEAQAQAAR